MEKINLFALISKKICTSNWFPSGCRHKTSYNVKSCPESRQMEAVGDVSNCTNDCKAQISRDLWMTGTLAFFRLLAFSQWITFYSRVTYIHQPCKSCRCSCKAISWIILFITIVSLIYDMVLIYSHIRFVFI